MGISDFFRKVRTLLEGDPSPDEVYSEEAKPERVRADNTPRQSASAARLAERMADEYVDPDSPEDDFDEPDYDSDDRYYSAPESYSYDDEYDDEPSEPEADTYAPPAPSYREPVQEAPRAVTADGMEAAEPLPTRTEVTLRQIEKLSKKLDPETLREYQMRLIRLKQETGAVSALTALRILNEYVQDDDEPDDGTRVYPDLSAR